MTGGARGHKPWEQALGRRLSPLETSKPSPAFDRMEFPGAILQTLPDALAIVDGERRLVYMNPAGLWLEATGLPRP